MMMTRTTDVIEMKIPAKPEYVGVVRLTVSGVANRLGYSYDDIEDIKIAVAEACTNVVNHAYEENQTENDMHLNFSVYEDRLELIVADRGGKIDVQKLKNERGPLNSAKSIDELKQGGLGLFLIETLMDKVEIHGDSGVVIIMTKFLKGDEVEQDVQGISEETPKQQ
jgi:serine/threonine-protein kinase RsbW